MRPSTSTPPATIAVPASIAARRSSGQPANGGTERVPGPPSRSTATRPRSRRRRSALSAWVVPSATRRRRRRPPGRRAASARRRSRPRDPSVVGVFDARRARAARRRRAPRRCWSRRRRCRSGASSRAVLDGHVGARVAEPLGPGDARALAAFATPARRGSRATTTRCPYRTRSVGIASPVASSSERRSGRARSRASAHLRVATQVLVLDVDDRACGRRRRPCRRPCTVAAGEPAGRAALARRRPCRSRSATAARDAAATPSTPSVAERLADRERERDRAPDRRAAGDRRRVHHVVGADHRAAERHHEVSRDPLEPHRVERHRRHRRSRARRRRTPATAGTPSDVHRRHVALGERPAHRVGVDERQAQLGRPRHGLHAVAAADLAGHQRVDRPAEPPLRGVARAPALLARLELLDPDGRRAPARRPGRTSASSARSSSETTSTGPCACGRATRGEQRRSARRRRRRCRGPRSRARRPRGSPASSRTAAEPRTPGYGSGHGDRAAGARRRARRGGRRRHRAR